MMVCSTSAWASAVAEWRQAQVDETAFDASTWSPALSGSSRVSADIDAEMSRLHQARIEAEEQMVETASPPPADLLTKIAAWRDRWDGFEWGDEQWRPILADVKRFAESSITVASHEILQVEWKNALASYNLASRNFNLALQLSDCFEQEALRIGSSGPFSPFLTKLNNLVETFEATFCDQEQVEALIRTLVPTHEALRVKLEIVGKECSADFATPWIIRDVDFLANLKIDTSRLEPAEIEGER